MKILHTSDWHLGRYLHEYSLIECQKYFLDWLIDFLKKDHHDVVIIAGDIYDRSIPHSEAVSLFSYFLHETIQLKETDFLIIAGNHDSCERLNFASELLEKNRIFITGDYRYAENPVCINKDGSNYDFYLVPFVSENAYSDSGEYSFKNIISGIEKNIRTNSKNILIGHAFVKGSSSTESERIYVGGLAEIDKEQFSNFDYTAMGHLHHGQKISDRAYYSGSPIKYSFSESDDDKHVISIDMNDELKIKKVNVPQKIDMVRIRDKFDVILNSDKYNDIKNNFIEAELTDSVLISGPLGILKKKFPNILSVKQTYLSDTSIDDDINVAVNDLKPAECFESFYCYVSTKKPEESEMKLFEEIASEVENEAD